MTWFREVVYLYHSKNTVSRLLDYNFSFTDPTSSLPWLLLVPDSISYNQASQDSLVTPSDDLRMTNPTA